MAKTFAPRVSKKNRKTTPIADSYKESLWEKSDAKLLRGAKVVEIELADIIVKEQVRTKFSDKSLKDLADNIKVNGLIQPLVLHRNGSKYTLICGERRFRAMSLIDIKAAPCYVLDNKSAKELMAIQFSENSSREELHFIDKADGILNYQKVTNASERKIVDALGISKTEVHRGLLLGKLPPKVKEAAKQFNIEKYVLLEFLALEASPLKKKLEKEIIAGNLVKRSEIKKVIKAGVLDPQKQTTKRKTSTKAKVPANMSASAFIKALESKTSNMGLDKETQKLLKQLMEDTKEIVN